MTAWTLGIDFGTTYTVAAVIHDGETLLVDVEADGSCRMPSAVVVDDDGGLTVGRAALHQATFTPERFDPTPKRWVGQPELLLGDGARDVTEVLAAVLSRVFVEAVKVAGGTNPQRTALTHPAEWAGTRRGVLLDAAHRAGIRHVDLVPEPVAAAARIAGLRTQPGEYVAVYDFGGGTFDAAVLLREAHGFVLAGPPGGLDPLGGDDIDRRIIQYLATTPVGADERWQALMVAPDEASLRASMQLREEVRRAKEQLSRKTVWQLWIPVLERRVQLSRDELVSLIQSDVDRTLDILEDTVVAAGVTPRQLSGIFLVGGSSRIPYVADQVWRRFGVTPGVQDDPKTVVALGAAGMPAQIHRAPHPPTPRERERSAMAAQDAGPWRSRLAMATTTAYWPAGAACVGRVSVAASGQTMTVTDELASGRTAQAAAAERWDAISQTDATATDLGLTPGDVLGRPGLERRWSGDGDTEHLERYAVHGHRLYVLTLSAAATPLLEAVTLRRPEPIADRFYALPFAVDADPAWSLQERLTLTRYDSGHRVVAESFPLAAGTHPGQWAEQRAAPYLAAGWQQMTKRQARILGRPTIGAAGGISDVARLLDGVPATVQQMRYADAAGATVARIWTAIVDERGYSVIVTLPAGDGGFKLLAAHAVLMPDETRQRSGIGAVAAQWRPRR